MRALTPLFLTASLALALTACGKKEEVPAPVDTGVAVATDAAAAAPAKASPGTYEVSDAAGKKLMTSTINADGTYADDLVSGQRVAGIVKEENGKTCFDPSGKAPAECYTVSPAAADGSFTATDSKGVTVTIKPKAM